MARFNFTRLLFYLSIVLAVTASPDHNNFGLHRRNHLDLGRLVKKGAPLDVAGSPLAQGDQAPSATSPAQPLSDSSANVQKTPANSPSSQPASAAASASPSANSSKGDDSVLSSMLSGLLPTNSKTASSTLSAASSSTSSSLSSTPQTSGNTLATPSNSILYLTSSATPTPTQTSSTTPSAGISHAAVTVLIVIAASVGAAVIVWTIIRKWKFRPSSDFEGRMQPIDWQPGTSDENAGLPSQHRPLSRASSFHSGSGTGHVDDQMRGPAGGYGTAPLNPIPDHDFTAGPAHLAPVGGYADLARGHSPQPMMHESYGVAPSINRLGQYDQHGVPLYHGYGGY